MRLLKIFVLCERWLNYYYREILDSISLIFYTTFHIKMRIHSWSQNVWTKILFNWPLINILAQVILIILCICIFPLIVYELSNHLRPILSEREHKICIVFINLRIQDNHTLILENAKESGLCIPLTTIHSFLLFSFFKKKITESTN